MNQIQISIIIPSFNSADFIKNTIYSCLSQEQINYEIIVVDDLGRDNTRKILEDLKKNTSRGVLKTIYRGAGLGQSTARNEGIKKALGKYICFLDADDSFCHSRVLKTWFENIEKNGSDMEIANFYSTNNYGKRSKGRSIVSKSKKNLNIQDNPELVNVVSCWQILYLRKFIEDKNIFFSSKLKQREDRLFIILALLNTKKISLTDLYVVDHFNYDSSSFTQINLNQLEQYTQHLIELNHHFEVARMNRNSNDDFERANAAIYLTQLCTYWDQLVLSEIESGNSRIIVSYLDQLRALIKDISPLYLDKYLFLKEKQNLLYEGKLDVVRLALKSKNILYICLSLDISKRLSYESTYKLKNVDNSAEECLTRYLSFLRKKIVPENSKKYYLKNHLKKIIIHMGITKTGSSSLQQFFERNRFKLWEQGYHYPFSGAYREYGSRRERTPGHAQLISTLRETPDAVKYHLIDELEQINSFQDNKVDKLIISSENIISARFWENGNILEIIKDVFYEIDDINLCVVFRHPTDWIISQYLENIGNHLNDNYDSFDKFKEFLKDNQIFESNIIIEKLKRVDWASLEIGKYESILKKGGIENWFSQIYNLDISSFNKHKSNLRNDSATQIKAFTINSIKKDKRLKRQDLENITFSLDQEKIFNQKGKLYTKSFINKINEYEIENKNDIQNYEKLYGNKMTNLQINPNNYDIYEISQKIIENYLSSHEKELPEKQFLSEQFFKTYNSINYHTKIKLLISSRVQFLRVKNKDNNFKYDFLLKYQNESLQLKGFDYSNGIVDCLIPFAILKELFRSENYLVNITIIEKDIEDSILDIYSNNFNIQYLSHEDSYWLT